MVAHEGRQGHGQLFRFVQHSRFQRPHIILDVVYRQLRIHKQPQLQLGPSTRYDEQLYPIVTLS
jgi:hypothetical protein